MGSRKVLLTIGAGLVSAALFYLGTGLHPLWPLLWLAPIPVLAIASQLRPIVTVLLGFTGFFIGEMNMWTFLTRGIDLPLGIVIASLAIPALVFGVGVAFTRAFIRRGWLWLAALALPVYWVTYEYLTAIGSPHSTFANLGYTQMNCLPVIQLASLTGIWGISFAVFLFAGTVAALLSGRGEPSQRRAVTFTVAAVLGVVFLFGAERLRNAAGQLVSVALIAKDVSLNAYLGPQTQTLELFNEYSDEILRALSAGTQVVVLPEKIGRLNESGLQQLDAVFCSVAKATHVPIDLGVVRQTSSGAFNSSRFYSPDGKVEANYDKHHLLPGVEPEKPGRERVTLDQPVGRWGLQICKDMDFPLLSREYARQGVNLMLVPAWDFNLDGWLHARMAVLRGVENGFALARAARNGLLTLSDSRGRILAEVGSMPGQFVTTRGQVKLTPERTFYAQTGDWFAWLCVATLVLLALSLLRSQSANQVN